MTLEMISIGVLLGIRHAFEPDHLAAISTQVAQENKFIHQLKQGIAWGVGHTLFLVVIASIILLTQLHIPKNLELIIECSIGILLITIGIYSIKRNVATEKNTTSATSTLTATKKSFLIGSAHGLAGSSAIVLLVSTLFSNKLTGLVYILIVGIGSIVGMSLITSLFRLLPSQKNKRIEQIAGVVSIIVGILVILKTINLF
ncbi:hypothetical protein A2642_00295 [Candidatus Nomurabacteria bacterium RIFCSPHIGHO2_01_FULL_39_10]|uniref:Nickel/cobalt efflux system n=1 Tax=Candidatus Nomurabacteria bacterium RIFCSPHIGHO2_01_FULL_39_10 TaxID=1801733 RepID=A0A1F6V3A7_9BACT|nr:MAG: hypothetical protein A2642_00295 [Candidatus Nomurabacteria bacterium RIFCSPHIGHO2_01_FULL_39_10]